MLLMPLLADITLEEKIVSCVGSSNFIHVRWTLNHFVTNSVILWTMVC